MSSEVPCPRLLERVLKLSEHAGVARPWNTDRAKSVKTASGGMRTLLSVWSAATTRKPMKGNPAKRRDRRPMVRRTHDVVVLAIPFVTWAMAFVNLVAG